MFLGVSAHTQAAPVCCYADAQKRLAAAALTPTGKVRKPRDYGYPLGAHYKSVTNIREERGGDIVFRLYDTDVITWHADDSVTIEAWASKTTGEFVDRFTPSGVNASFGGRNGAPTVLWLCDDGWQNARVIHGDVTLRRTGDTWEPDVDTLRTFRMVEFDRKQTREISKQYNLADFNNWLSMAPRHIDLQHADVDCDEVADALLKRDFKQAAVHLPLIEDTGAYNVKLVPLNIATRRRDHVVTMTSLQRFRQWLYEDQGAMEITERKILTRGEYDRQRQLINQLAKVGVETHRLGFGW